MLFRIDRLAEVRNLGKLLWSLLVIFIQLYLYFEVIAIKTSKNFCHKRCTWLQLSVPFASDMHSQLQSGIGTQYKRNLSTSLSKKSCWNINLIHSLDCTNKSVKVTPGSYLQLGDPKPLDNINKKFFYVWGLNKDTMKLINRLKEN